MIKNKHIYADFGKELEEEVRAYKAHSEKKTINNTPCTHKGVSYKKGMIQCVCGACWTGANLDFLYKKLKTQS